MALKKRTRVIAWIFMLFSALMFVVACLVAYNRYSDWWWHPAPLLAGLQWPVWIGLLRKRSWAWSALMAMQFLLAIIWIGSIGYWLIQIASTTNLPVLTVGGGLILIFRITFIVLPFLILATDRPSGWQKTGDSIESNEKEVTETESA